MLKQNPILVSALRLSHRTRGRDPALGGRTSLLDVCELEDTAPRRPSCRCCPRRVCLTFRVSCPVLGPQSRRMVTCHSQGRHSQLLWWTDSEAAPRPPPPDVHAPCEPLPTCDLLPANGIGQRRWDVTFTSMLHKITTSICWKLLPCRL